MYSLIFSRCVARPVVARLLRRLGRLLVGGDSGGRLHAFGSLAGNRALVRVLAGYALDATHDGHFLRRCGRGEGVGEIALLRAVPRTATVTACTAATVYRLNREPFLTAVLGHAPTQRRADDIAQTRLATGTAPGNCDTQETTAPEPG